MKQVIRGIRNCSIVLLLALPAPMLLAHHSFAVHFVSDQLITVNGTVTSFRFTNPHGIVTFSVTKEDGSVEQWRAETNSPNALRRRGWTKDSIKVGEEIEILGFPTRDGSPYMRISKLTFADGRELVGQAQQD
ncbi:MAG: DUF6152 family protein [Steroidobacteraceae bacterium]|jgi:hypothetical protein